MIDPTMAGATGLEPATSSVIGQRAKCNYSADSNTDSTRAPGNSGYKPPRFDSLRHGVESLKCLFGRHDFIYIEGFQILDEDCERCRHCSFARKPAAMAQR